MKKITTILSAVTLSFLTTSCDIFEGPSKADLEQYAREDRWVKKHGRNPSARSAYVSPDQMYPVPTGAPSTSYGYTPSYSSNSPSYISNSYQSDPQPIYFNPSSNATGEELRKFKENEASMDAWRARNPGYKSSSEERAASQGDAPDLAR